MADMVQPLAVESNAPEELRVESRQEVTGYLQELHREQSRVLLSSPDGFALQTRIWSAFSPGPTCSASRSASTPTGSRATGA